MKLMIFGLDAAAMNFIKKRIDKLDYFKEWMDKGAYGTMEPIKKDGHMYDSMNLWASFYTGLHPIEHTLGGIPMRVWNNENFSLSKILKPEVKNKLFWNILNKRGYKVGLFDGILMNPVFKIDGFVHSAFPLIDGSKANYPENITKHIESTIVPWGKPRNCEEIGVKFEEINTESTLKKMTPHYWYNYLLCRYATWLRGYNSIINIIKEIPVDVLFYFDIGLDGIGHTHQHDPNDKVLIHAYQTYEMFIKKFIDKFKPDNVIICSDHGMDKVKNPKLDIDFGLKAAEKEGIISGNHSEDAMLIMFGKDIKEKGELKDWDLIKIHNKILEVCG